MPLRMQLGDVLAGLGAHRLERDERLRREVRDDMPLITSITGMFFSLISLHQVVEPVKGDRADDRPPGRRSATQSSICEICLLQIGVAAGLDEMHLDAELLRLLRRRRSRRPASRRPSCAGMKRRCSTSSRPSRAGSTHLLARARHVEGRIVLLDGEWVPFLALSVGTRARERQRGSCRNCSRSDR